MAWEARALAAGKAAVAGGYATAAYQEIPTSDGVAFTGTLTRKGRKVATFAQGGDGGATAFRWKDKAAEAYFNRIGRQAFGQDAFEVDGNVLLGLLEAEGK